MNLPCCYTDEHHTIRGEVYTCDNRRLPDLPMCQRHMHETFRAAIYADTLPTEVWRLSLIHISEPTRQVR